jgi:hypothetical protein
VTAFWARGPYVTNLVVYRSKIAVAVSLKMQTFRWGGLFCCLICGGAFMSEKAEACQLRCTEKEKKLLELIRGMEFGELRVTIRNSEPFRVEEIRNSIKL